MDCLKVNINETWKYGDAAFAMLIKDDLRFTKERWFKKCKIEKGEEVEFGNLKCLYC